MLTSDFDYNLPEELIAQTPAQKREESKMMVLEKSIAAKHFSAQSPSPLAGEGWGEGAIQHKHFYDIVDYLDKNDVLVLNDTKVIPARLLGEKTTGAKVEVFLLKDLGEKHWEALLKPSKRINPGNIIQISDELAVRAVERLDEGKWRVQLAYGGNIYDVLNKVGNIPLPPYIERKMQSDEIRNLDYNRYQTVFAKQAGSVAAPTAGLHFTPEILERLKSKGVEICYVTLNVGLGTFRPVKCDNILEHKMDLEEFEISQETADVISASKAAGKNIVAVGTTSVRTLETAFQKYGEIRACKDSSEIFIYPPYEFKVVDKLITNFHLPKSTLIMLVSALAGREFVLDAYKEAIENKYRFYSYGDCMLIQ